MARQRPGIREFIGDEGGAMAAIYALALPALVAMMGIGFDYARLAAMDTELQNAADEAALAGATQLDQQSGAVANAMAAARGGLVRNTTLFANDGKGTVIAVPEGQIYFYATRSDAEARTNPIDITDGDADAEAAFIRVVVDARTANYALTPVVGAFKATIDAEAVAGIGAALCRTPPLMICNPEEPAGNVNPNLDFEPDAYEGVGLLAKGGGGSFWEPGNFGYLDTVPGSGGGTPELRAAMGWNAPPGQCISRASNNTIETEPGNKADIADSLNTRFDIYNGNTACPTGGTCSASINSTKDVVAKGSGCGVKKTGWDTPANRYLPASNAPLPETVTPDAMGHPRDICHSMPDNECPGAGPFGDGVWDRDAYFRSHYRRSDGTSWNSTAWQANTGFTAAGRYPTRYQVYQWEIDHRGETIDDVVVLANPNSKSAYGRPRCDASGGVVPVEGVADRRRISVAVINCKANGVRGNTGNVPVRKFIDVFLVQPSLQRDRTAKDEIYVEIIGKTKSGSAGETAGTVIRRDVPYLIR